MDDVRKIQLLAVKLHQMLCPHDHGETCRWYMETGNDVWEKQAHNRWYFSARIIFEYMKMKEEHKERSFEEDCLFDD